jgi:Fe2+ transport system protein B
MLQSASSDKREKAGELEKLHSQNVSYRNKISDLTQELNSLNRKVDEQELQIAQLQHTEESQIERIRLLTQSEKSLRDKLEQSLKTEKDWALQVRNLQDQIEEADERANRESAQAKANQQEAKNWKTKMERAEESNKTLSAGNLLSHSLVLFFTVFYFLFFIFYFLFFSKLFSLLILIIPDMDALSRQIDEMRERERTFRQQITELREQTTKNDNR